MINTIVKILALQKESIAHLFLLFHGLSSTLIVQQTEGREISQFVDILGVVDLRQAAVSVQIVQLKQGKHTQSGTHMTEVDGTSDMGVVLTDTSREKDK